MLLLSTIYSKNIYEFGKYRMEDLLALLVEPATLKENRLFSFSSPILLSSRSVSLLRIRKEKVASYDNIIDPGWVNGSEPSDSYRPRQPDVFMYAIGCTVYHQPLNVLRTILWPLSTRTTRLASCSPVILIFFTQPFILFRRREIRIIYYFQCMLILRYVTLL